MSLFGSSTATGGNFSFGANTSNTGTTTNAGFGTSVPATPSPFNPPPTLSLTTPTPTSATSGFHFGAPSTTTATATTNTSMGGFSTLGASTSSKTPSLTLTVPASSTLTLPASQPSTSSSTLFPLTGNASSSSSNMTGSIQTQQPTILNPAMIQKSTRYSELPDEAKTPLDQLENFIRTEVVQMSEWIKEKIDEKGILRVRDDIIEVQRKLSTLDTDLDLDTHLLESLLKSTATELKNAEIGTRVVDQWKTSHAQGARWNGGGALGLAGAEYFWRVADNIEKRMIEYQTQIEEVERTLASLSRGPSQQNPSMVSEILHNQHTSFLSLASCVAELHDRVQKLKNAFLAYRKRTKNDDRDIFEVKRRRREERLLGGAVLNESRYGRERSRDRDQPSEFYRIASTTLRPTSTIQQQPSQSIFGSTPQPSSQLTFGSSNSFSSGFGGGLSLGATQPRPSGANLFGSSTASSGPTGFAGFGSIATSAPASTGGFSFGSTPALTTTPATTNSFGFGPTPTSISTGFGTTSTAPTSFGGGGFGLGTFGSGGGSFTRK